MPPSRGRARANLGAISANCAQLLSHSWVRGESVPETPLPETAERLRAFKKASAAFHGSLVLAALLHQDEYVRKLKAERNVDALQRTASGSDLLLRRVPSMTEGAALRAGGANFDVVGAAWSLFDPTGKA